MVVAGLAIQARSGARVVSDLEHRRITYRGCADLGNDRTLHKRKPIRSCYMRGSSNCAGYSRGFSCRLSAMVKR